MKYNYLDRKIDMAILVHFEGQCLQALVDIIRQVEFLVSSTHALVLIVGLLFIELNLELAGLALVLLDRLSSGLSFDHLIPNGTLSLEDIFLDIFGYVVNSMGAMAHVVDLISLLSKALRIFDSRTGEFGQEGTLFAHFSITL